MAPADEAKYFDIKTGLVVPCTVSYADQRLHIYFKSEKEDLLVWNLRKITSCEWSGPDLFVCKSDARLELTGDMAQQVYTDWNEPTAKVSKPSRISSINLFIASVFCILVGCCLLLYFYVFPWTVKAVVRLIPARYEIRLGETMATAFDSQVKKDSANYYIGEFAASLELSDVYPIEVKIIASPQINAFAIPGGKIFVYSGLLEKMTSADQLVALLGHETSHVTERHALKSMFSGIASNILISLFFGDFSAAVLSQADKFRELSYSRKLETEADNKGLELMKKNKVDPLGMFQLLQILQEQGEELPGMMMYISTHPDIESRIRNVSSKISIRSKFPENQVLRQIFAKIQSKLKQ